MMRVIVGASVLLHTLPVAARTPGGQEIGMTRLATIPLDSAVALGMVVPIIAVMIAGLAIALSLRLDPLVNAAIAGSLVVLGSTLAGVVLGAEVVP